MTEKEKMLMQLLYDPNCPELWPLHVWTPN